MDLWSFKSKIYYTGRSLPLVRWILNAEVHNIQSLMREFHIPSDRVLDIGSGAGSTLGTLPKNGFCVCMDRSSGMLKRLKKMHAVVVLGDALFMPVRSETISFVSAVGLTEYVPDKDGFLDEVKRVLRPGGLFLSTISPPRWMNVLRNLLGSRIHSISGDVWEAAVFSKGFRVLGKRKSMIQIQYLMKV